MTPLSFFLPDLGEGLTESEIVAWHVSEGDHVVADQPLVSIETEKAVVEVPAPFAGTVARLCASPGDIVKVGEPLVEFDEESTDTGTVVGELPTVPTSVNRENQQREDVPAAGRACGVHATPAVRQRAKTLGVQLDDVAGTGPGGSITTGDIERAAGAASDAKAGEPDDWQPLRGIRRTMAKQMSRAGAQVVPATLTDEVDIHSWPALGESAASDPTLRLVQAISMACKEEAALNAWYDPQAGMRQLHGKLRLGLAVDTSDGLIVPVVDIDDEDADALRSRLKRSIEDARQRLVAPAQLSGATFTLSNFGALGGRHAALVVVPPQVAILGAGRIKPDVVAEDGKPVVHRMLPLSLTFDHRVVSGGEAARFMSAVIVALQSS